MPPLQASPAAACSDCARELQGGLQALGLGLHHRGAKRREHVVDAPFIARLPFAGRRRARDQTGVAHLPQEPVECAGTEQPRPAYGAIHAIQDVDAGPRAVGESREDGEGGWPDRHVPIDLRGGWFHAISH